MFKKIISIVLIGCMSILLFTACSTSKQITIGSKDYTENVILAELVAQLIENKTDIKVQRKLNMGGTFVCFEALRKGQIDIYPEYTGTALTAQLNMEIPADPNDVFDIVKKEFDERYQIKWMETFGFNNTFALALSAQYAEENNIKTISDLVPFSSNLIFGAEHEFFNRQDGYDGLVKVYGLTFKDTVKMNVSLKYQAMAAKNIDVTNAFSTDGQLLALKLKVLEDNLNFFPPYYAAPIVKEETLKKYPELEALLNQLGGIIDEETMQGLNYKVDNESQKAAAVAKAFLQEKGLI